ncbi:peptidoglycan D,D-transpeptidase FtsI family protein [Lapidilactobacillus wuchangensis]|uniref:peptidoglycan D,D-transpeptidase FtsI family protein n=1 Tax=Lapidilactobacillus wuchangensis TaxID=2486001 RepID=UPI000F769F1D|nr:penicillin-binding protein 2 [Lapidilactobacillus wuchangensis]
MMRRQRKTKRKTSSLRFRLNLLFFIAFLLLAILVAQLGYLQIVFGDKFESEVERTDKTVVSGNVPRGVIYDAKGRVLVGNQAENAITYTKSINVKSSEMLATAKKLTKYLKVDVTKLQKSDLADYYLADADHYAAIIKKLPKSQLYDSTGNSLSESKRYHYANAYVIKNVDLSLSDAEQQVATIYTKMASAYQLSTVYLKDNNVTADEVAEIGEHLSELPGVAVGNNWTRNYPNGDSISSILGNVTTEQQGLPEDSLNQMLTTGYSRNDRVGNSYLEKQYESILRGTKSQTQVEVSSSNQILNTLTEYSGTKGSNLNLTIDSAYQAKVEADLQTVYNSAKSAGATKYSDGAYAIAMNPNTGAIYAMAGIKNNPQTNQMTDDALGVINRTFVMGSAVKGATVLGAMMDGVITPTNNTLSDDAIYLPATPVKKSVYPIGTFSSMNAVTALEVSSNIYMMRLAMLEGKAAYSPHTSIKMDDNIFQTERNYFQQFGLGYKTGIDLPGEVDGYIGSTLNENNQLKVGSALDLSYGNYDGYTLMQMGQYISTIANGGYRMQPYLVNSIQKTSNSGEKDAVIYQKQPVTLNRVGFTNDQLAVVKQGMYNVVHGTQAWGTAHALKDVKPSISAKTGTAQSFYYNPDDPNNTNPPETLTSSFVGYAPSDNPTLAIAIVFPNLDVNAEGSYNTTLAKMMVEDYFKLEGNN